MSEANFPSELFLPFLNADQKLPQYIALFRAFQQSIVQGKLIPGAKLPATRPLAHSLGVSRNTVKSAYEMLLAEGYIETIHGSGSFVSSDLPDQKMVKQKHPHSKNPDPSALKLSDMAKRLAQTSQHSGYSHEADLLSHGRGCLKSFPWLQWQRHVSQASRQMKYAPGDSVMGNARLRTQIANYLRVARGVHCQDQQIMICSGSQQAMYLSFQLLLNQGDYVLVEDPGYKGIEGAIDTIGAIKVSVETDQHGFNLGKGLEKAPSARVISLTPTRNYPMGHTLSLERRIEMIDWAKRHNAWIIEDDYDSEFRFDGPPVTSLQGLGGESCVIYAGTFSRILHPSIRLGYLVIPEALVTPFHQMKRFIDGGLSQLPQLALAEFMAAGHFTSHVRRMRKLYQQRREILHNKMDQLFPGLLQRIDSDGGMHSVFLLPDGYSDVDICQQTATLGLGIQALSEFYSGKRKPQGLVIGFAAYDETAIDDGLNVLSQALHNYSQQI